MKKLLLCVGPIVLLAACATEPQTGGEHVDKEYRTGSNLPQRERSGVQVVSPESIERQRDQATGNVGNRPGMGK